jgi:ribose transport system permease protein
MTEDGQESGGIGPAAAPPGLGPESAAVRDAAAGIKGDVPAKPPRARPGIPEAGALTVVLIALVIYFSVTSPYFLAYDNLVNISTNVAIIAIIAAPATVLLIGGQFDLSVGAGVAWVGVVVAWAAPLYGLPVAVALGFAGALIIGLFNGLGVTLFGVNALITTLASLAIFRGLTKVLADGQTLLLGNFSALGTARPLVNIPLPVYVAAVTMLLFHFVLRYTVYGRSIYAIGASPAAARLAGIRTRRVVFIAFMLSSTMVGIAGLIQVSQLGAAAPVAASGLELSVVTAVILGGASLAGGRGTMFGTLLAVLILGVLNNGLILLKVPSFWQDVTRGLLLFAAVAFDQLRIRLSTR